MDAVSLGVGFLLGILGAGFGVVLEQVIVARFHRAALLRALRSEVDENLRRIGDEAELELRYPLSIMRRAWDAARETNLADELREVLEAAYALGERLNDNVATASAYFAASATLTKEQAPAIMETQAAMGRNARAIAKDARERFTKARGLLARV